MLPGAEREDELRLGMNRTYFPIVLVALLAILLLPSYPFAERGLVVKETRVALVIGTGSAATTPTPVGPLRCVPEAMGNLVI